MSTPQTPPRASLTTLPTEIKAKIVEMAYLQQEAWKERDPEGFRAAVKDDHSRWHPLSLVSKEFRELSAVHIFKVLNSWQTIDPTFRSLIYWKHRDRISRARLDISSDQRSLEDTFEVILPGLPNLRSLNITYEASVELFGDVPGGEIPTETHKLRLASFGSFGSQLTQLELDCFKYLAYNFLNDVDTTDLLEALFSLTNLDTLTLISAHHAGFPQEWTRDWWDARQWTPPPVKHLSLELLHTKEVSTFINLFTNTLQSLTLLNYIKDSEGTPDHPNRMSPSGLTAYRNLVRSRNLEADFEDDAHNPFASKANLEYDEDELDYLIEALDRTLYFGRQDVERIRREKDVAKAVRWVEVLGALEGERRQWKD
ncbi:hypothetical protein RQP46_003418 [Phenoliferia psychrophenolica]